MKNKINYKRKNQPNRVFFVQSVGYYKTHLFKWMKTK